LDATKLDVTRRRLRGSEPSHLRSRDVTSPDQRVRSTVSVAVVFPGQGTQEPGMAAPWRDHPAWRVVEEAEDALGEKVGFLVTEATAEDLARTREAQLAVLLTSLVVWDAMQPLSDAPIAFAGHSLGQV